MKSTIFKHTTLAILVATTLSACGAFSSLDEVVPDNTKKYRKAETMPALDVPPDLTTQRINKDFAGQQDSAATYSEYQESATNPLAEKYNVDPAMKPALAGEGATRHLVVPSERDITWQRVIEFWDENKLAVTRSNQVIGLMDTAEDADGYAYRVRVERGDTSKMTMIYLENKGNANNSKKNEATLRKLADYLGVKYQQDVAKQQAELPKSSVQTTSTAVLMDDANGQQALVVDQDFPTVWLRVGRVLDSKGFTVEDRNRGGGVYFVRYIDPFRAKQEDDSGILDTLAFWRDDEEKNPEDYYYIKLISDANNTRIVILNTEKTRISDDTAKRLLGLIQEQLTQ